MALGLSTVIGGAGKLRCSPTQRRALYRLLSSLELGKLLEGFPEAFAFRYKEAGLFSYYSAGLRFFSHFSVLDYGPVQFEPNSDARRGTAITYSARTSQYPPIHHITPGRATDMEFHDLGKHCASESCGQQGEMESAVPTAFLRLSALRF